MADADRITILSCTGLESMPQEALAIVAQMLVSKRSTLEFGGRGLTCESAEPDTTLPEIQYHMSILLFFS